MFNKLKQFKDLKNRAKNIQTALSQESAEGSAGWGKLKIRMDGNQHITQVLIDQSLMTDKSKLEELIKEAGNDAVSKIQKIMSSKLRELGGLDLANELGEATKK